MKTRLARPIARLRQGRNDWYRFENIAGDGAAAPDTAMLHLYEEIGYWGITAQDLVNDLAQVTAGTLEVHLNSPGGDVFDGIAIKNALEQHPATVNITVDGIAASIASVIAMAGDSLAMAPGSQMMIHEASGLCIGNADDMQEMQQLLDFQSANIAAIYAGRAGGDADDWRTAMKAETWYTADEAVAVGLADKVLPGKSRVTPAPDAGAAASNTWDLSIFRYAGRENAPDPSPVARAVATGAVQAEAQANAAAQAVIDALRENILDALRQQPLAAGTQVVPAVVDKAIAVHHTKTVDTAWDGPAAVAAMPAEYADLHYCHAWQSAAADASSHTAGDDDVDDKKSSFKFPHHAKKGGPANLAACRNGLARLDDSDIPDADKPGVKAHLQAHLDDAAKEKADDVTPVAPTAEAEQAEPTAEGTAPAVPTEPAATPAVEPEPVVTAVAPEPVKASTALTLGTPAAPAADAWAATVAHLTTPQTSTWAAAVANLTTGARRGGQDTKEIAQ